MATEIVLTLFDVSFEKFFIAKFSSKPYKYWAYRFF